MVTDWPPSIAIDCVASVAAGAVPLSSPSPWRILSRRGASRARARRSCQTLPGASTALPFLDGATRDTLVSRQDDTMDLMELSVIDVAQATCEGKLAGRHMPTHASRLGSGHIEAASRRLALLATFLGLALLS